MSTVDCKFRIGTSGWHYNHWRGKFYPAELKKYEWFDYYSKHFDTVEINNTFYQQPKDTSIKTWYKRAPQNFTYAVKANRFITHIKKLKDPADSLRRFLNSTALLKEKLGPVLYQLPPSLHQDLDRLKNFAMLLPKKPPAVFEFRHKSWFTQNTFDLLSRFHLTFCIHDMPGIISPRAVTADIIYIRFHGPTGRYQGNYSKAALRDWAEWIKDHAKNTRSIFAYFNNDYNAYAIRNAGQLKELLLSK